MLCVDAELFHHLVARRTQAKPMQADHLSIQPDIPIPGIRHAGFDCDATPALRWQNFITVFSRLTFEALEARHRNDAYPVAQFLCGSESMLQLAPA